MKAKEWVAKLSETPDNREETLKAFVEEIGTVAKQRGGSHSAIESALREQRAKWQAVCRDCPAVDSATFETMLEAHGQEFKKAAEMARSQAANRTRGEDRPGGGRKKGSQGRNSGRGSAR